MKLYALANLCPRPIQIRSASGFVTLPSQGVAVAGTPCNEPPTTPLHAGNVEDEVGFYPYQPPAHVHVPLLRDEVEGIVVPLAVAEAMRFLGQKVRYQVFTPSLLATAPDGSLYAPHLLHHADLTEVTHADG